MIRLRSQRYLLNLKLITCLYLVFSFGFSLCYVKYRNVCIHFFCGLPTHCYRRKQKLNFLMFLLYRRILVLLGIRFRLEIFIRVIGDMRIGKTHFMETETQENNEWKHLTEINVFNVYMFVYVYVHRVIHIQRPTFGGQDS